MFLPYFEGVPSDFKGCRGRGDNYIWLPGTLFLEGYCGMPMHTICGLHHINRAYKGNGLEAPVHQADFAIVGHNEDTGGLSLIGV